MNDVERPSSAENAVGWAEAAQILGWKVETLRKRTTAGIVPHVRIGKSITFVPSVLRAWMVDQSLSSLRERQAPPSISPVSRRRRAHT